MIIVKNRKMVVPYDDMYIGTTYDDDSERRIFRIDRYAQNERDLSALTFRLDIKQPGQQADTVILDKDIDERYIYLIWNITNSVIRAVGLMFVQIRAIDNEATVKWSTYDAALYVARHLNTPGSYTGSLTEIEQMEQDFEYMKSVVEELKANLDYAHDAEAWAKGTRSGSAVPSTDDTYHNNSKYYSEQANASKTAAANSATAAAGSATQAAETVADTNTRFNNAVAAVTVNTEVQDARVGADGTTYTVLKNRLDAEHTDVKSALVDLANETTGYTRIETVKGDVEQVTISKTVEFVVSAGNTVTFEMDVSDRSAIRRLSTLFYNGNTLLQEVNVSPATKTEWVATGNVTRVMIYCGLTAVQPTALTLTAKFYDYYGKGKLEKTVDSILVNMQDDAERFLQNLINTDDPDYTENAAIVASTGNTNASNYFNASGFIRLKPNTKYYVGGIYTDGAFAYYDENKKYIAETPSMTYVSSRIYTQNDYHGYFTTGNWTRYIRVSIGKAYANNAFLSEYYDQYMQYGSDPALGSEKVSNLVPDYQFKSVLVIGDSISTGASSARLNPNMPSYANYDKWVDDLISIGFFPAETTYNCSQHATGYIQRAGSTSWSPHSDFYERLLYCENEGYWNKEDIDLIVIFGGINDYGANIPIGADETDYTTYFTPAVRNLFDYLLNNYTQARICIILPLLANRDGGHDTVEAIHIYTDVIADEAKKRALPVLNLTDESGFYPFNTTFMAMWTYLVNGTTPDGLHPNYDYQRKYLAPMIKHFLDGMM